MNLTANNYCQWKNMLYNNCIRIWYIKPISLISSLTLCKQGWFRNYLYRSAEQKYQYNRFYSIIMHPSHAPLILQAPLVLPWSSDKVHKSLREKRHNKSFLPSTLRKQNEVAQICALERIQKRRSKEVCNLWQIIKTSSFLSF